VSEIHFKLFIVHKNTDCKQFNLPFAPKMSRPLLRIIRKQGREERELFVERWL
jgi:hypothetical protein